MSLNFFYKNEHAAIRMFFKRPNFCWYTNIIGITGNSCYFLTIRHTNVVVAMQSALNRFNTGTTAY